MVINVVFITRMGDLLDIRIGLTDFRIVTLRVTHVTLALICYQSQTLLIGKHRGSFKLTNCLSIIEKK